MKILIAMPFEKNAAKGNSIAGERLEKGFRAAGAGTEILAFPEIEDEKIVFRTVSSFRPDVILIMHAWRCSTAFRVMVENFKIPLVISMRGTDLNEMLTDPEKGGEIGKILSGSDGIAVFHEAGKQKLIGNNPQWEKKIRVIPNGATLPDSSIDYRSRMGFSRETFLFLGISGLREVKRPLLVIPWLIELKREFPQLGFAHAGSPLEKEISGELDLLRNKHDFLFHYDSIPHSEIDSFLRSGDVFISSGRSEGMPHSVREAMLSSLSMMLSDIEGHRNMAVPEFEALFFSDRESFLSQAKRLIAQPDLRNALGKAALKRVKSDFENDNEITSYMNFFSEILIEDRS